MANTFTYQGREFGLSLIKEGSKLHRVVINDGGLEFPFAQGGYDKVAEFLLDEYGGNKETALEVLNAAQTLEGLEVAGAPASVSPEKGGKNKSARKP
jgi:hypothetical protein